MKKSRCARGFQNLPHTSGGRYRKCGENRDRQTRPPFWPSATCGFVGKNRCVLGKFRFFPALPKYAVKTDCQKRKRDNIQLSRKHQRAIAGKPNNDPSLSSPHVESATTVSLRPFYRNARRPNRATSGDAAVQLQPRTKYKGMPSAWKEPPCNTMTCKWPL